MWEDSDARQGLGLRLSLPAMSARGRMVLFEAVALFVVLAAGALEWKLGGFSIIRLLHWWAVFVQGDDSWMPMRAAYDWYAAGHTEPLYHHVMLEQHVKFQYPPASLLVFALPEGLHIHVSNQALDLIGWFSVLFEAVLTGGLAMLATRDWPEMRLRWTAAALTFALTLTFYPVLWAYKEGQIQTWLSALFVLSTLSFFTGRKRTSGALIGVICMAKPQFLLFLIWALLRRERSFAGAMAVIVAVTSAAALYVFGWSNHVDYLSAVSFMSHHGEAFVRNYSVNGVMNRLLGNGYALAFVPRWYAPYNPLVYWTTVVTSVAFIGGALWHRARQRTNLVDFLLAGLSFTIASPIAWEHHYGILPPAFLILALVLVHRAPAERRTLATVALFAAFLLCDIILPPIASLASGPASVLQATVFLGAVTVLVLLYRLRDQCPDYLPVRRKGKMPRSERPADEAAAKAA